MRAAIDELAGVLESNRGGFLVVVTGAGISLASGIPTFRGSDPDAVWKRDVTELGTLQYFREDPVGSWQWTTSRFDMVLDKRPNPAHRALVDLERWQVSQGGRYLLITQNVDTLHEDAGSEELIKVHGSVDKVRCATDGCANGAPTGVMRRSEVDFAPFFAVPSLETLPRCTLCGDVLRQHVLWFDEYYDAHQNYQWGRVTDAARRMDMVLFVGTSFAVGVTELFLQAALQRALPALAIDPGARSAPFSGMALLREKSEELLPAVCERLGLD